jgi:hypothetical protein
VVASGSQVVADIVVARALSKKIFQMYVRTYVVAGNPVSCR